ncbi:mupirocin-resistant isoleucine--tRNA ligase [Bifidobacterium pseudolongum subsp. globosum]|jgi:isoleucyl-tRNA synthetase|uniref:Isoleucine--tRNA ligase n=1 Tax=Bifidobacterium pseudolongum TaxID=1694 RepID=A0AB37NY62_9BIFI|nr:mupirocin-resistant isoleucine--tRNA ligase [Bifidobacterium pseudolongum]MCI1195362.1 mupirocin-resistant isoleucine--tRNA ligase [Bifidobacterium pseudolongum subsp. globosum]NBH69359.1 isoleucine--tRNA ligase [Bifidobacterium pseudolongum]RKI88233.1 mupirocin-resistant isoleucine--tRNA ligase [Bifidobacterium pseudolongum]UNP92715.1 mupirocin-resistant isoleucine--tRNA ligase [Bifidobacterium pseudolongum subsp. globosum]UNZ09321.1 mupirocin-resistant isoleucine--tRNA ligase [Bifidobacte
MVSETPQHVYPKASVGEQSANVAPNPDFPQLEQDVLRYWDTNGTFQKSIDENPSGEHSSNEFVFFDGPPFANGLPHYGHLLTGYAKDVVPRYQTMKGRRVNRVFGWDTHGLPAELEAQKELGIDSVDQIEQMGIDKFNDACRASVLKYVNEWRDYVHRQARWVDFEHGYKTLDIPYMESVMWAFKTLYEKGLAYKGYRVLPYCPKDQTPLSAHELRMDADVYQDRQDTTVSVAVKLRDEDDAYAVFWTTTPWTVPTNFAIVVGADIDYVEVRPKEGKFAGKKFYFAKALLGSYNKELGEDYEVVRELKGSDMVGWRYYPVFPYFASEQATAEGGTPGPNAYQILTADYVDTAEGTGLVHQAPYGEDDMNTLNAHDITSVDVLDSGCRFTSLCPDYEGMFVFDANLPILRNLRAGDGPLAQMPEDQRALLFQEKSYVHSYPHCWRCGTPLIYKPVSSWFVSVTKIKPRLLELNQEINWIPDNVKDGQFGKWLSNARDWSISRNRFWGSPIPVWVSDDPKYPRVDVYGSLDELKADFGDYPRDHEGNINMHRPYIDELTRPNPDDPTGKSTMHRISDVLDCWFESGSMPFAQYHYPFENKEYFEQHFPSDFIVEYIGQTRGWFYLLHVMATALFDKPAFKNVICHGIVLGDDGQKMSKHLRNYPDVNGVFDKYGSDAMRWFLMSSPILRGGNLIVTSEGIRDTVRQIMLPVWSSYYFFTLYANAANNGQGYDARELTADEVPGLPQMDRYLLARTRKLIAQVSAHMDAFEISDACDEVSDFIDMLTNWYIRNTRDRFWNEDENAFNTLYTVLEAFMRVLAPLAPMEAETVWRGLTGGDSVHLGDWPYLTDPATSEDTPLGRVLVEDGDLVAAMDKVREVVSATLSLRKAKKMRVRQPLAKLTVVVDEPSQVDGYDALLKSELNIKDVEYSTLDEASDHGLKIIDELKVNARAAGPRLGKQVQFAIKASKSGDWHTDPATGDPVIETPNGAITLQGDEYDITRRVEEADAAARRDSASSILPSGGFVILDLELTGDLIAEGYARDVIRAVQDARKDAGLEVSDRIVLTLTVPADDLPKVEQFRDLICSETLSTSMQVEEGDALEVHVAKA